MDELYAAACASAKVRPNTCIVNHLEKLASTGAIWNDVDLSRNHCGLGNGFAALLVLLSAQAPHMETFDMSFTELEPQHVIRLCDVLKLARGLRELRLRNCGLYLESVAALLTLLRQNTSIVTLDVSSEEWLPTPNTFPQVWSSRLDAQVERNRRGAGKKL